MLDVDVKKNSLLICLPFGIGSKLLVASTFKRWNTRNLGIEKHYQCMRARDSKIPTHIADQKPGEQRTKCCNSNCGPRVWRMLKRSSGKCPNTGPNAYFSDITMRNISVQTNAEGKEGAPKEFTLDVC